MISTYIQIASAVFVLCMCLWDYRQAVQMATVNRRRNLNGSGGVAARAIKRRSVILGLVALIIIFSGTYILRWVHARPYIMPAADQVIAIRSFSFTFICLLIVLNIIWDIFNRRDAADLRAMERAVIQKRRTDPQPGEAVPLASIQSETEDPDVGK